MSHTVSPTEESKHNFSGIQNKKSDDTIIVPIPPDNRLMSSNALNQDESQEYNQDVFEQKPGVPLVEAFTPYFDFLYKIDKKQSIRFEGQYMHMGEVDGVRSDYGSWAFGLVEFGIAPHWTFVVSDMYNISPGKQSPDEDGDGVKEKAHYPRFDVYYTFKSHRLSLSYIKQVEGVVCTGGICRLEPAFSGVRLSMNATF